MIAKFVQLAKKLIALPGEIRTEIQRRRELEAQLEQLIDPTLIDRMYLDHQIMVTVNCIDNLTPKLREISDGLK